MTRHIPYSKEEIANPNLTLNADYLFKSWGYTNLEIKTYREWRLKRARR